MTISIWARYKDNAPEVVDRASNQREAGYLLGEYMLAYGACPGQCNAKHWTIWAGKKDQEPRKEK